MQHTISVLVVNRFGVLSRISGLFSGRGFNIESLNVAETNDPNISRMTIVTLGDEKKIEQITKQLNKLVDVGPQTYTIEITGSEGKIKGILDLLRPLGIKELVRSGRIALSRGIKSIN